MHPQCRGCCGYRSLKMPFYIHENWYVRYIFQKIYWFYYSAITSISSRCQNFYKIFHLTFHIEVQNSCYLWSSMFYLVRVKDSGCNSIAVKLMLRGNEEIGKLSTIIQSNATYARYATFRDRKRVQRVTETWYLSLSVRKYEATILSSHNFEKYLKREIRANEFWRYLLVIKKLIKFALLRRKKYL